jgi:hypothetical protein
MKYEVLEGGTIYREADMAYIPPDPDNADYQNYLTWMEQKESNDD